MKTNSAWCIRLWNAQFLQCLAMVEIWLPFRITKKVSTSKENSSFQSFFVWKNSCECCPNPRSHKNLPERIFFPSEKKTTDADWCHFSRQASFLKYTPAHLLFEQRNHITENGYHKKQSGHETKITPNKITIFHGKSSKMTIHLHRLDPRSSQSAPYITFLKKWGKTAPCLGHTFPVALKCIGQNLWKLLSIFTFPSKVPPSQQPTNLVATFGRSKIRLLKRLGMWNIWSISVYLMNDTFYINIFILGF